MTCFPSHPLLFSPSADSFSLSFAETISEPLRGDKEAEGDGEERNEHRFSRNGEDGSFDAVLFL